MDTVRMTRYAPTLAPLSHSPAPSLSAPPLPLPVDAAVSWRSAAAELAASSGPTGGTISEQGNGRSKA